MRTRCSAVAEDMIHHISLGSNDLRRSRAFYDPVLAILQLRLISSDERELVYGTAVYLLNVIRPLDGKPALAGNGSHVAFSAYDRGMVNEFYRVANRSCHVRGQMKAGDISQL
jgi:catechol 2,3-dioxygenase-like lactoylglutathione lyase family enzyme